MGRTLKRVPLDFNYPIGQVWKGYLNPYHSTRCKACNGTGMSPEYKKLSDDWYTHNRIDGKEGWCYHLEQEEIQALIDADRLMDFTRVPINDDQKRDVEEKMKNGGNSWLPYNNGYIPTADEVNKWARNGGHDSINQWICVKERAKRLGITSTECSFCNGEGEFWASDKIKQEHEEWSDFEPPVGDGYQLWETTSEGSPSSPVFETLNELCEWCADNATTFASYRATKEEWRQMLDSDFVSHKEGNMIFI